VGYTSKSGTYLIALVPTLSSESSVWGLTIADDFKSLISIIGFCSHINWLL